MLYSAFNCLIVDYNVNTALMLRVPQKCFEFPV